MPQDQQQVRNSSDDAAACRPSSDGEHPPCPLHSVAGCPESTQLQQQLEQSNACPQGHGAGLNQHPMPSGTASASSGQPAVTLNADPVGATPLHTADAQPGSERGAPSRAQPAAAHLHKKQSAHHQQQCMSWHDQESSVKKSAQERLDPQHGVSSQGLHVSSDSSPLLMAPIASGHDQQQRPQQSSDGHAPPSSAAQTSSGQLGQQQDAQAPRDIQASLLPEYQMSNTAQAPGSRDPSPSLVEQAQPADICLDSIDIERQRR